MKDKNKTPIDNCLIINNIRSNFVAQTFANAVGKKTFILIPVFPFMVIGHIVTTTCDYVFIKVETTHVSELESKVIRIHLDDVEAFYIQDGGPPIPEFPKSCVK